MEFPNPIPKLLLLVRPPLPPPKGLLLLLLLLLRLLLLLLRLLRLLLRLLLKLLLLFPKLLLFPILLLLDGIPPPPLPSNKFSGEASRVAFNGLFPCEEKKFCCCPKEEGCESWLSGADPHTALPLPPLPPPLLGARLPISGKPPLACNNLFIISGLFNGLFANRGLLSKAASIMTSSSPSFSKTSEPSEVPDRFKASLNKASASNPPESLLELDRSSSSMFCKKSLPPSLKSSMLFAWN
mmetsp:Transcript_30427/g.72972  ORF Transcript_30427/g.72972 Transcript_30427/m.72972 type:complete len:240 (-) Transcript_30427:235-954(-)